MRPRRFDVVKSMLIASILLPGIPIPGFFVVRPEEILALALLPAILGRARRRLNWIDLSFIVVGISTFISMVWGTLILNVSISPRDMMEFVKIIKAWTLFWLALAPWSEKELASMARTLLVCLSVSALIGILEWQDWLGLSHVLQGIYVTGTGNEGTWRIIGTVGNPNYYGLLMALGLAAAVNLWNYDQRRAWRWLAMMGTGLCTTALFLTNSRSSVLAATLAICLSAVMQIPRLRYKATWRALRRVRWQVVAMIVLIVGASLWAWNQFQIIGALSSPAEIGAYRQSPMRRTFYRLSEVKKGFDARVELMWEPNLPLISASPVFGWGPAKAEQRTVTDNGYILTLRRYGFLGLLSFLMLYGQVSRVLFSALHGKARYSIGNRLTVTSLSLIVGYMGANMFLESFYSLQLLSWLWLLIGIAASSAFYRRLFSKFNPPPSKAVDYSADHSAFWGI